MMVELSTNHSGVPIPVVLSIRRAMYANDALPTSDKFFKCTFLFIREDITSRTHHDDNIIIGQSFFGKHSSILRDVNLKPVLRSQFFDGCYSFRNGLVPESLGFAKNQSPELLGKALGGWQ